MECRQTAVGTQWVLRVSASVPTPISNPLPQKPEPCPAPSTGTRVNETYRCCCAAPHINIGETHRGANELAFIYEIMQVPRGIRRWLQFLFVNHQNCERRFTESGAKQVDNETPRTYFAKFQRGCTRPHWSAPAAQLCSLLYSQ